MHAIEIERHNPLGRWNSARLQQVILRAILSLWFVILISANRNSTEGILMHSRYFWSVLCVFFSWWRRYGSVILSYHMDMYFSSTLVLYWVERYEAFDPGGGFLCFHFRLFILGCQCTYYHRLSYLWSLGEELEHSIQHHRLFMLYSTLVFYHPFARNVFSF